METTDGDLFCGCNDDAVKGKEKDRIWEDFKSDLKSVFSEEVYSTWLSKLGLVSLDKYEVVMSAPNRFYRDYISREFLNDKTQKVNGDVICLQKGIKQVWLDRFNDIKVFRIITSERQSAEVDLKVIKQQDATSQKPEMDNVISLSKYDNVFTLGTELNPKHTFDNFVVGKANQLAFSLAKSVAENTVCSSDSNPLFLYGGVGLGKTHLIQAIAWYIKEQQKGRNVVYLSAERFMYQFINALRNKDIMTFKERFRAVDVLIIDDIQFIAGKDSTQSEFFHTFNSLIEDKKQVILACDRSPRDINGIDAGLKSRIGGGLIVDIHPADFDLRYNILKSKIAGFEMSLSPEVMSLLSEKINSSIRDLEGALKKVIANHRFTGEEISIDNTKYLLRDILRTGNNNISIAKIQETVADYYHIKVEDLKAATRSRNFAQPRQIAMYLSKKMTIKSLPEIGNEFGGKNHATVIHAVKRVNEMINGDSKIAEDIRKVEELLRS